MVQMMRGSQANSPIFARASTVATRGGGGSWHRPDLKPYPLYKYTRRYHLEDINSVIYSDFAPEFHMHMHSMWVQGSKQGMALLLAYFCVIIFPAWCMARSLMKYSTAGLYPSVRSGGQHDHMGPGLVTHLRFNNCENAKDKFGRNNAMFYRNWVRQENSHPNATMDQFAKHL